MTEWIISSSVLICAMMLLRGILRGKISPRIQYALWGIVLLRLMMPFSLFQSQLSVHNVQLEIREQPAVQQVYQTITTPIPIPANTPITTPVAPPQVTQPAEVPSASLPAVPSQTTESQPGQEPVPAVPSLNLSPADLLICVWVLGIGAMSVWMAGCNLIFSLRLRRTRIPMEIPDSLLSVYHTDVVDTPCLFGLFRPAVYLTTDVSNDHVLCRYVLTHELVHYRQFDHVWSVLRTVALVLHWYNPLVWVAFHASRQDAEMSCDEGTLRELGEEHRSNYGRTIISLATRPRFRGTLITATSMSGGKRAMKERIVILMKNPKTAMMTMISLILCCALIVGCTFTGAVTKPTEPEETAPTEITEPTEPAETTVPTEPTVPEAVYKPIEEKPVSVMTLIQPDDPYYDYYARLDIGGSGTNWIGEAMGIVFDKPTEISPYYLFYNGLYGTTWDHLDEHEALNLQKYYDMFDPEKNVQKLTQELVESVLVQFGTSIIEVMPYKPEGWVYFQSEKAYYTNHDDYHGVFHFTIRDVVREAYADGEVIEIYYSPYGEYAIVDDGQHIYPEEMVITLYLTGETGCHVLANQVSDGTGRYDPRNNIPLMNGRFLTAEQLAQVNEAFEESRRWVEGDLTKVAPTAINGFFRCYYTCPEEIDLSEFLRHFTGYGIVDGWDEYPIITESEFRDLSQLENWPWENVTELKRMPVPIHKFRSQDIDAVLRHYAGIGLDQLNAIKEDSGVLYSSKYDSYYNFTSDYGPGYFHCIGGRFFDDRIELYDDQNHVLTLVERDGKYCIYSFTPVVWNVSVELGADEIDQVNERFKSAEKPSQLKALHCFFTCYYEDPTQIDLKEFLRQFTVRGYNSNRLPEVTEEEFDEIRVMDGFPYPDAEDLEDLPASIHCYPAHLVDSVLENYTNVGLKALTDANGHGGVFYSEKHNAYYCFSDDFNPGTFVCTGGYIQGSIVVLYSEDSVLTLHWNEYEYYIYSHLPRE